MQQSLRMGTSTQLSKSKDDLILLTRANKSMESAMLSFAVRERKARCNVTNVNSLLPKLIREGFVASKKELNDGFDRLGRLGLGEFNAPIFTWKENLIEVGKTALSNKEKIQAPQRTFLPGLSMPGEGPTVVYMPPVAKTQDKSILALFKRVIEGIRGWFKRVVDT